MTTAAAVEETPSETDHANAVQASNGSDLAGKWSMLSYLSMIVIVLALMSALWLLPRMRVRAKPVADEEELGGSPYTSN